jgi:hypothetical protein
VDGQPSKRLADISRTDGLVQGSFDVERPQDLRPSENNCWVDDAMSHWSIHYKKRISERIKVIASK